MKILITSWQLAHFTGAELYACDFARALRRRGHEVVIYTPFRGRLADAVAAEGIVVIDDFKHLPFSPDILHGHHQPALVDALLHVPHVPAIFVVHNAGSPLDEPFLSPRIRRYVAVDSRCFARIAAEPFAQDARIILNFVDLGRFEMRPALPAKPRRALLFSNYATEGTHLPAVAEACRSLGLPFDVAGRGTGTLVERPEEILGRYDVVFAKARCALEAMATGAAVVLCDIPGLGPMVTTENFAALRPLNFGAGTLTAPLVPAAIASEIAKYDADDAMTVGRRVRTEAGLEATTEEFLALYREVLAEAPVCAADGDREQLRRLAARWRPLKRKEAMIELMRRVRRIPLLGDAAYRTWRAGERVLQRGGTPP